MFNTQLIKHKKDHMTFLHKMLAQIKSGWGGSWGSLNCGFPDANAIKFSVILSNVKQQMMP